MSLTTRLPALPRRLLQRLASQPALWCGVLALPALAAAWHGGLAGLAGALAAAALAAAARPLAGARMAPTDPSAPPAAAGSPGTEPAAPAPRAAAAAGAGKAGRVGPEVMVCEVVPVWSRQMQVTREATVKGIDELLATFGNLSTSLDQLTGALDSFGATASPGAMDRALDAGAPAVQALLEPSTRAFAERDAMLAVLTRCADVLAELQAQAKQAREIARHTRLVALNASIEATRSGGGANGTTSVATELRTLAGRMADTGAAIDRRVAALAEDLGRARRDAEIHDTTEAELRLELDLKARAAMAAMLAALGSSLRSSSALREISQGLRGTIDEAFVQFQFGDRVSQMLDIVGRDMQAFVAWVGSHPHATQNDAADWLANLQAAYTMEEQRSQHHGNVHVERESEVEFF